MRKTRILAAVALLLVGTLGGCAHQPPPVPVVEAPGFLSGLAHGFLIGLSLVASLFTDVRIYAFPNSGFWYDLGYLIGASAFLGGAGKGASRRPPAKRA
jgi:hypothetical protein